MSSSTRMSRTSNRSDWISYPGDRAARSKSIPRETTVLDRHCQCYPFDGYRTSFCEIHSRSWSPMSTVPDWLWAESERVARERPCSIVQMPAWVEHFRGYPPGNQEALPRVLSGIGTMEHWQNCIICRRRFSSEVRSESSPTVKEESVPISDMSDFWPTPPRKISPPQPLATQQFYPTEPEDWRYPCTQNYKTVPDTDCLTPTQPDTDSPTPT